MVRPVATSIPLVVFCEKKIYIGPHFFNAGFHNENRQNMLANNCDFTETTLHVRSIIRGQLPRLEWPRSAAAPSGGSSSGPSWVVQRAEGRCEENAT